MNDAAVRDAFGAFMPGPTFRIEGAEAGPLCGLTFAAKDLYDVAGQCTGAGNPDYLSLQKPAAKHSWAVQALLDAGAALIGRAITVEMAFGMAGDNLHYGMPINPTASDRVPGGSSCGSVAAVAGKLCDTALGSDTGGSVRIPASYCGLYGLRPTHGRIPLDGVVPLSASFDTVGHFARDATTFEAVGRVLLRESGEPPLPKRMMWATDLTAAAEKETAETAQRVAQRMAAPYGGLSRTRAAPISTGGDPLEQWAADFRTLMAYEAWKAQGPWITAAKPKFGPDVAKRFEIASKVSEADYNAARPRREAMTQHLKLLLAGGGVLCFPTAPGPAPLRDEKEAHEAARFRAHVLCAPSGLARLPQVTVPAGKVDGAPIGLSFLGGPGTDATLLRLATTLAA
jgi:amidase